LDLNINSLYDPLVRDLDASEGRREASSIHIEPRPLPLEVSPLNEPHPLALELGESILYNLGQYYMQEGRFDEAIAVYNEIVKLCHHNYHRAKQSETDAASFDATSYFFLSSALLDAGLTLDALNVWATGYAMDPDNPLLKTQRHKDNSIICTNAEVIPLQKSKETPGMIRNFDGIPSRLFEVVTRPDQCWVRNSLGLPLSKEEYVERKKFLSSIEERQNNVIDKSSLVHVHGMVRIAFFCSFDSLNMTVLTHRRAYIRRLLRSFQRRMLRPSFASQRPSRPHW
jgi:tetratricopeptide (TPR) repeat protein